MIFVNFFLKSNFRSVSLILDGFLIIQLHECQSVILSALWNCKVFLITATVFEYLDIIIVNDYLIFAAILAVWLLNVKGFSYLLLYLLYFCNAG